MKFVLIPSSNLVMNFKHFHFEKFGASSNPISDSVGNSNFDFDIIQRFIVPYQLQSGISGSEIPVGKLGSFFGAGTGREGGPSLLKIAQKDL